jgi:hypothetical protein
MERYRDALVPLSLLLLGIAFGLDRLVGQSEALDLLIGVLIGLSIVASIVGIWVIVAARRGRTPAR